ncbi:MAG: MerR family transcriptional regulator [Planctomycetia bacterium]|nr:MerR family transcriptional regulator [Planctomycetia bacterium]
MWTVGQVAKHAGVNIETLRYYEQRKLLPKPLRKESGYRLYDEQSLTRLRFIKRSQKLGFTLREIRDLLDLSMASVSPCRDVRDTALAKIADIELKIKVLTAMRNRLRAVVRQCPAELKTRGPCPILADLEKPQ